VGVESTPKCRRPSSRELRSTRVGLHAPARHGATRECWKSSEAEGRSSRRAAPSCTHARSAGLAAGSSSSFSVVPRAAVRQSACSAGRVSACAGCDVEAHAFAPASIEQAGLNPNPVRRAAATALAPGDFASHGRRVGRTRCEHQRAQHGSDCKRPPSSRARTATGLHAHTLAPAAARRRCASPRLHDRIELGRARLC
jgi:hypothetical protein